MLGRYLPMEIWFDNVTVPLLCTVPYPPSDWYGTDTYFSVFVKYLGTLPFKASVDEAGSVR